MSKFNYKQAFSRNLGFFTPDDQKIISKKVVAVPGQGGVGGHHLHTLVRLGFQNFKIADFDEFEVHNFNRQIGAMMSSVDVKKTLKMKEFILDINPDAKVESFEEGVTDENIDKFLDGVDILVDGLDVYVIKLRIRLFERAHEKGIPVITAAPLGMGTSVLAFDPNGMSFNEYFNLSYEMSDEELFAGFLAGVTPKFMHASYLIAPDQINFSEGIVPSLHIGCLAATSALGSIVIKIVLNRGKVLYAPKGYQIDFYKNKMKKFWRPCGNKNPLQKLLIKVLRKQYREKMQ